ncbi:TonB-dependent receptor [Hirschia litorea]|uniref:TonB-dependent receptor n=1 Tax=Hirschia litorea TaxID=1199156 RepID=A0ABW2IP70_9PROT
MSGFKKVGFTQSLLGAASVVGMLSFAQVAVAQETVATTQSDAAANEDSTKTLDTIVVTGFKKSLADAIASKRDSGNVTDGISAEDIGKSADSNIAEALQRVTGVSINRQNGEGTSVTVRGINANLNNVTLNGVTVTTASGDVRGGDSSSAVDFSAFSSDILSQIEVVKTPSADHDEGSLGASIILNSFKPLDARKDRRIFEVQTRYNDLADENELGLNDIFGGDSRFNVSLSEKFLNDTLGVGFVATSEETSTRRDAMNIQRWEAANASNGAGITNLGVVTNPTVNGLLPGGFTDVNTGELISNPRDETGAVIPEQRLRGLSPFEVTYEQTQNELKRDNLSATIQWRPTDNTDLQFDGTYTEVDRRQRRSAFSVRPVPQFFPFHQGNDIFIDPATGTITSFRKEVLNANASANPTNDPALAGNGIPGVPGSHANIAYVRPSQGLQGIKEKTIILGMDLEHVAGEFTFNLSGGTSRSTAKDDEFIDSTAQIENQSLGGPLNHDNGFGGFDNRPGLVQGYDCENDGICSIFFSDTVPNRTAGGTNGANPNLAIVDDHFEFDIGSIASRDRKVDDKSSSLFFDVDWDHQFGPITKIEVGAKYSKRQKIQRQTNSFISRFGFPGLERRNIVDFAVAEQGLSNGFGEGIGLPRDSITDGIVAWDPVAMRELAQSVNPNVGTTTPAIRDFRDLENTVYGAYLKANFEFMDGRIRGDIGGRYASTDVSVGGGAVATPSFEQFNARPENLAFFGYNGVGDPTNTATLAEATAQINAIFGDDLVARIDPAFLQPIGSPVADTYSYDNFLPSLNVNYQIQDDMILRFAASQTMARPNIDFTRPNFTLTENTFSNSFAVGGNPRLNPFLSNNLDLSYEWYFDEGSLFSFALFDKQLKDSVRQVSQSFYLRDFRDILFDENGLAIQDPSQFGSAIGEPGFVPSQASLLLPLTPGAQPLDICLPNRVLDLTLIDGVRECEVVQVNQPINAASAYVRGMEIGVQHNFDNLPGIWSGFGFTANYTYSDSEVEAQTIVDVLGDETKFRAAPLPNTSLHTFNTTVFYEKDGTLLRLAYNNRSDFLISSATLQGGTRVYGEGFDTLDASGGFDITDNLRLSFQAVNLLDTVTRNYAVLEVDADVPNALPGEALGLGDAPTGRTQHLHNTGRIFRVGLRYEF